MPNKYDYNKSIEYLRPHLIDEWSKKNKLNPKDFMVGSGKKVWWRCKKQHEWETAIRNRCIKNRKCPYCGGIRPIPGETDLATKNPNLASEWHPFNNTLKPTDVLEKSNKKVWWLCKKGHEWEATISNRTAGNDCPYCAGRKAIAGETDLATLNPQLAKQWHPKKNKNLTPTDVTVKSGKKVWWVYPYDDPVSGKHFDFEWQATVSNRVRCPECPFLTKTYKRAWKGFNDLETRLPELANEWHPTKNGLKKPSDYTVYSGTKVWWICSKGHEWNTSIIHRSKNHECPYCQGNLAIRGENDAITLMPILKNFFDENNNKYDLRDQCLYSKKQAIWKCDRGHSWKTKIANMANHCSCPYCSGRKAIKEETDLKTIYPEIASEWNQCRNGKLSPEDVLPFSNKKVWWKCSRGHEWRSSIINRTRKGYQCPKCNKEN